MNTCKPNLYTVVVQDVHAGRDADPEQRTLAKAMAMQNVATYISTLVTDTGARVQIICNGDILHGKNPAEFNAQDAVGQIAPLLECASHARVSLQLIPGNWDVTFKSIITDNWEACFEKRFFAAIHHCKNGMHLIKPTAIQRQNGTTFTHGHLAMPTSNSLKAAVLCPPLLLAAKSPYICIVPPMDYTPITWSANNRLRRELDILQFAEVADYAAHNEADAVLRIQENLRHHAMLSGIANLGRTYLDTIIELVRDRLAKQQLLKGTAQRIVLGHTHTVVHTLQVLNVGTSGADMRSCATFGVIDPQGKATVLSAWHPEEQAKVVPYSEVRSLPVDPIWLERSYVLTQ